jgi:hypothetical protein
MSSSPDFGELRRDPPPPYGVSAPPRPTLPPDHGVSSSSPPIAAIAVELGPSRSRPCGLIYSGELRWSPCPSSMVLAVSSSSPRRLNGYCNPDIAAMMCRPFGREHDAAPSPVQPLDGGLAATTVAAPSCHRHGLPPCSSVSTPVSFFSSSLFLCVCDGGLASEPGILAYAVAVVLLKLVLLDSEYCYCEFQCKC